ncbi:UDP-N-acetylmuramoylalanyl-D-glutamate--2,6- diaminopimelate ligase [Arcticibacter svalbardensis MN12-7]|uniref:UDP-N-acetylmuramoyl-L-alanyl-D-glutamate--2,6-diaminopimelate ligase n=1 Tax=Arcticibacter svalbardensis MN12-7 TaxID=1150600 RepID=R9GR21_9SPHI|nr:UDP-N-acetylmuramoyl-L-alanyl-D-glutamate--2,6-diaminopimelate ligase [Arcticibacter svalbardensis]EOR94138.1 UDP-N-acetylmuramoylalanyl-D-glutamate--2,6- diaminopimelate ligase [Arcticibacter svalbardensis MN12-7]
MIKTLTELLSGIPVLEIKGSDRITVDKICFDSRQVVPGSLFIAVKGTQSDGHAFIAKAIDLGAIAIVCESLPEELIESICYIVVADSAETLGTIATHYYDNPSTSLKLVGVTGTNGKTTVATLLFKLFKELGYKVGLLSTVENYINNTSIPATHTTPDPIELNALLADMVEAGCDYCFMEVSSHAISQHRIAGLEFTGGVFTNITHDHLDFHKTFDSYLKAKRAFFDGLPRSAFALTNADDRNGSVMLQNTKAYKKSYALKSVADFKVKVIENELTGLLLEINGQEIWFKLIGNFNAYNLISVYATAMLLEQDSQRVLTILSRLTSAEGRFDCINTPSGIIGIVDYAHTPDAVQNVLSTIHTVRKGIEKVITVIGCGGDRDKTKRKPMAQIACDWSDKVIITSDNPRSEDPMEIIREMESGVSPENKRKVLVIADRAEAIRTACHLAQAGDIVLVAGKGHEKYQEINGVKYPFDDKKILTEQLIQIG